MVKYQIRTINNFDRKYSKLIKKVNILKQIRKTVNQLERDPFHKALRTHKVNTATFGKRYASFVTGDIRIIWDFVDENTIIVILTIGGHEGKNAVYK